NDIEQARKLKDAYAKDLAAAERALAKSKGLLNRYIPNPEDNSRKRLEAGEWKRVYDEAMNALQHEVDKSFPTCNVAVERAFYGPEWPEQSEMRARAREYWRQRYLFEALAAANDDQQIVPVFSSLRFLRGAERLLHPSHGDEKTFNIIPFEVQIVTDYDSIALVLAKFMECEVPLNITALQMSRGALPSSGGGTARRAPARAGASRTPSSGSRGPSAGPRGGPMGGGVPAGPRGGPMGGGVTAGPRGGPTGGGMRAGPRGGPMGGGMASPVGRASSARPSTSDTRPADQSTEVSAAALGPGKNYLNVTISGYLLEYRS
ncbi:MAG: hypothetical protein ACYS8L_10460, partial [Planctomycetota bacterium]